MGPWRSGQKHQEGARCPGFPVTEARPMRGSRARSGSAVSSSQGRRTGTRSASSTGTSSVVSTPRATGSGLAGRASSASGRSWSPAGWPGRGYTLVLPKRRLPKPAWMEVVRDRLPPGRSFRSFRLRMGWTATFVDDLMTSHRLPPELEDRVALILGMSCSDFRRASCAGEKRAGARAEPFPAVGNDGKSRDGGPHPASGRRQDPRAILEAWGTELLRAAGELRPLRGKPTRRTR